MSGYVDGMTEADQRLFQACSLHRPKVVAQALAFGAQAQTRDADGKSPLHAMAIELNRPMSGAEDKHQALIDCREVAMLLIEAGADIECRCKRGLTALEAAAELGKVQTVKILLELGAKLGNALHRAARSPHLYEMAQELLRAGADPLGLDECGLTPMDHAQNSWSGVSLMMVALLESAEISARVPQGIKSTPPRI
jgi:ankyrin repeat protein